MSALPSLFGAATAVAPAPAPAKPRARGFLHIVRHGVSPGSVYVLTYHRLERLSPPADREQSSRVILPALRNDGSAAKDPSGEPDPRPKPILAEGAQALIDLLERIGVDFHRSEVRGALEDILRLGSANIPDLWLSDDDLLAKGLAES
jgi:hypothetical protein